MINEYFTDIEERIIEQLQGAKKSVLVAVAWFTSSKVKACLLSVKRKDPSIEIKVVVDPNPTNVLYFFNSAEEFRKEGIILETLQLRQFLHHKFIVIDGMTVITGSYNLTGKAKRNRENMVVIQDAPFANSYTREYQFLTAPGYIDENIAILFEFPLFAQQLLSTYYRFNSRTLKKYRRKIIHGDCYTAPNGLGDVLYYEPGYIFNPRCDARLIEQHEFGIPINKAAIKEWTRQRNQDGILESFRGFQEQYHLINDALDENDQNIATRFETKIKNTHDPTTLRNMITNSVDIIIENQLWANNFNRFLHEDITHQLFNSFPDAPEWPKGLMF